MLESNINKWQPFNLILTIVSPILQLESHICYTQLTSVLLIGNVFSFLKFLQLLFVSLLRSHILWDAFLSIQTLIKIQIIKCISNSARYSKIVLRCVSCRYSIRYFHTMPITLYSSSFLYSVAKLLCKNHKESFCYFLLHSGE